MGTFAFASRTAQLHFGYTTRKIEFLANRSSAQSQQMNELRGEELRFLATHFALIPFEVGFFIFAKLLVLNRMQKLAVTSSVSERAWVLVGRLFYTLVTAGLLIGVVGNVSAAVIVSQAAGHNINAADAWSANKTTVGNDLEQLARTVLSRGVLVSSVQRIAEMAVLLIVVFAFAFVGTRSTAVIQSALRTLVAAEKELTDRSAAAAVNHYGGRANIEKHQKMFCDNANIFAEASDRARQMRVKTTRTFLFFFATCLVRSVLIVFVGVISADQDLDNPCSANPCDPCRNVSSHVLFWFLYTPGLQAMVMTLVSPIALLVALWGMSGIGELEQMSSPLIKLQARWRKAQAQPKHQFRV